MCDQHFEEDLDNYLRRTGMTRRRFGALGMAMGLMAVLPRAANALDVNESGVEVRTPDGVADCYFVHPASGAHAGVLIWPDILGLRPAFRRMGEAPCRIGLRGAGRQSLLPQAARAGDTRWRHVR